jgi:predicted transcriptional regulator
MSSIDEQILRAAKEIVVKFIETGRISPTTFPETFKSVYTAVNRTVKGLEPPAADEPQPPAKG